MWQAYYMPASTEEALALLAGRGPGTRLIAGGTDLLVELKRGTRHVEALVDVTRIAALGHVREQDGQVRIGATLTHHQAVATRLVVEQGRALAEACWQVGTPALRNRGTIAGNLVTASPANDTITALVALDAGVTLRSVRGGRYVPLSAFYTGVRETVLAPDEMVTEISFPSLGPDERSTFVKLGLRRTHAIALVNAAAWVKLDGERVRRARIALGSVAPTIVRARDAEESLVGRCLDASAVAYAADLAARAAAPIDDIRSGASYRRRMVSVLVRRALSALGAEGDAGRAGGAALARAPMLWGDTDGRFGPLRGSGTCHKAGSAAPIECVVNGRSVSVTGAADKTLLEMLREDLGLTGAKEGCGEGECGACTVWMDGIAVLACLIPAPRAHGTTVVTVEGLAAQGQLHPVQQAFVDEGAVQCGYCTPGFVMSGANLLHEIEQPTREQIAVGLSGNLCRCTGYYKIVRAIERAAAAGVERRLARDER
ncbi:MAG: FAD binding domain-containing protein [Anaerolineae bacterium]|nr:FAD binding domain-containing protein [Anaerolineae bacterium]